MPPNPDDERDIKASARVVSLSELNSSQIDHSQIGNTLGEQALQFAADLQSELDGVRDQLAWSNRLSQLGMLTAALAHETNNLLTPIGSYAQLALANPGNAELTERALKAAIAGSKKGAKLVEGVMEVASPNPKNRTGSQKNAVACKVNEVVEGSITFMLPIAKQLGVNVISRVEPATAAIDALALEQVLINLISNACQAMRTMTGKRAIHIESSELNGRLILRIIDTGPGIPKAIYNRLFEPFVTTAGINEPPADNLENQATGSGLGLSICKQIVEAAGGQIGLVSSSEHGSTFSIELPLTKQP